MTTARELEVDWREDLLAKVKREKGKANVRDLDYSENFFK